MINNISIENFKVFKNNVDFNNLKNINFLTGVNGRGKSSMLQVLITLAQSFKEYNDFRYLCLNGGMINLGNAIDVKNEDLSREKDIIFEFGYNDYKFKLNFKIEQDNEQAIKLKQLTINDVPSDFNDDKLQIIKNLFTNLVFISAERLGPKLHYDFCNDTNNVGTKGEFVACALYNHKDDIIQDTIIESIADIFPEINPEELDRSLKGQVQFWLSQMFRPTFINVEYIAPVNEYTIQFGAPDRTGKYKPTNVGFGYSYALPIIVASLLAKPESIIIIENPEAHLHPMAQSILSKFLSLVSKTGVQFFIETHSEHIINAPRVMIVQESFSEANLNILYFDERYFSKYTNINVLANGKIENWPDGFFDQAELDNDIILGL